jgi:hypothetical protein
VTTPRTVGVAITSISSASAPNERIDPIENV